MLPQKILKFVKRVRGFLRRRMDRFKAFLAHRGTRKLVGLVNAWHPDLKVRLLDIGARRGFEGACKWMIGLNHLHVEGIEPDRREAEAVMAHGIYHHVHPVAVADQIGKRRLYITKVLGCTSLYKPKVENLQRYAISPWFDIQKETDIDVTTLDVLYAPPAKFDFITMDVQGAEFEIIKGGERLFDEALGVSLEVHFVEIYEGQKLFSFMHDLFLKKGFRLLILGHCDFDGEIAEAECAYVKDHQLLTKKEDFLKCILFAASWNSKAYVENALRNAPDGIFSSDEKNQILRSMGLKMKQKSSPWPDGYSGAAFGDGSGYL